MSHETRAGILAVIWLLTSGIGLIPGGRYFGHYFHLILPAICLLAAIPLRAFWARRSASAPTVSPQPSAFSLQPDQDRRSPAPPSEPKAVDQRPTTPLPAPASATRARRTVIATLIAAPAVAFFLFATFLRPWVHKFDDPEPPYETVAAHVRALTQKDDRIFVWGNSPQMYVLARRPMGSRFSFCNYMTGEASSDKSASPTPREKGRGLDDAWRMLFDDLEQRKPRLFLDAAAAGWDGYAAFPIANYPRLAEYLAKNFRLIEHVAGVAVLERAEKKNATTEAQRSEGVRDSR